MAAGDEDTDTRPPLPRRGALEAKPAAYLDRHEAAPARRAKGLRGRQADRCQVVYVAAKNRIRADPRPDVVEPILTGRYEQRRPDRKPGAIIVINQAGRHLEGFIVDVLNARQRRPKTVIVFSGKPSGMRTWWIHQIDQTDPKSSRKRNETGEAAGELIAFDDGELRLNLFGGRTVGRRPVAEMTFDRFEHRPTLSARSIRAITKKGTERRRLMFLAEFTPLTSFQQQWLERRLSGDAIERFIKKYATEGELSRRNVSAKLSRRKALSELNYYLSNVFSDVRPNKYTEMEAASNPQFATEFAEPGWHPNDVLLASFVGRSILVNQFSDALGVRRPVLDCIQVMLDRVQGEKGGGEDAPADAIRKHLKLASDADADNFDRRHIYEATLDVLGGASAHAGVGIGAYLAMLKLTKSTDPKWTESYRIWFGELSVGPSVGVTAKMKGGKVRPSLSKSRVSGSVTLWNSGAGSSSASWFPQEIPGTAWLIGGDASANAGLGASLSTMLLHLNGNEMHSPLILEFPRSVSLAFGGISVGVKAFSMWGWVWDAGQNLTPHYPAYVYLEDDFAGEIAFERQIHFRLGDALLTDEGRQALRLLAASELYCFMSSESTLAIIGHADRVDCRARNIELSKLRAQNVLRALKDILGDDFNIPEDKEHLHVAGLGETSAEFADWFARMTGLGIYQPDGEPDPRFRRVDIVLNGRLVLRLQGQGKIETVDGRDD
jgi:flagellar motor protein MotB